MVLDGLVPVPRAMVAGGNGELKQARQPDYQKDQSTKR
jgi:hypothetical protein